jgi:hypothetical protein
VVFYRFCQACKLGHTSTTNISRTYRQIGLIFEETLKQDAEVYDDLIHLGLEYEQETQREPELPYHEEDILICFTAS